MTVRPSSWTTEVSSPTRRAIVLASPAAYVTWISKLGIVLAFVMLSYLLGTNLLGFAGF